MIGFLIFLLILLLVVTICIVVIDYLPLPPQILWVAKLVIGVIALIALIMKAAPLLEGGGAYLH